MKIFITGIAGFIGSHLAKHFTEQGHYVFGVDNLSTGQSKNINPKIHWEKKDIRDKETFENINETFDVLIHLAAQSSGEKSFDIPLYDIETNIKGSYLVYEFSRKCNARLLINFSSMSVYGSVSSDYFPVGESYNPTPTSLYGNSKLCAENLLNLLSKRDNLPVIHMRLFSAYGGSQNLNVMTQGIVSIFLSYILSQKQVVVKGSLERIRDFIYIDDVIRAIDLILKNPKIKNNSYNLCTGKTTNVGILIKLLMEKTGIKKPVIVKGTTLGDIQGFPGSYQKIYKDFGWEPRINLEEGISKMLPSYIVDGK